MQYAVANGTREVREAGGDVDHAPARGAQRGSAAAVTRHGPSRLTSRTASASSPGGRAGALRDAEPGVVDQHVEPAEPLDRLGHRGVDRRLVAHVARDHVGAVAVEVEPDDLARRARAARRTAAVPMPPRRAGDRARRGLIAGDRRSAASPRRAARRRGRGGAGTRRVEAPRRAAEPPGAVGPQRRVAARCASRYQLEQPPWSRRCPASARWISRVPARPAPRARTSSVAARRVAHRARSACST